MAEFTYNISASIEPPRGKVGETVKIAATVTDVEGGDIRNVVMSVPQYGVMEYLRAAGDGDTYSANFTIPWEAPSANYDLRVYATSTDNERGPQERLTFTVS